MEKNIDEKVSRELSEKVTEQIVSQIKIRMPKGERYWYIDELCRVVGSYDGRGLLDNLRYEIGNYFHTKEEAESMARKLRAVLKGADVIEMPSGINEQRKEFNNYESERQRYAFDYGFERAVEIFKSKIIK